MCLSSFLKIVLIIALVTYPVLIYFGLSHIDIKWIALFLLIALTLRALLLPREYRYRMLGMVAIGVVIAGLTVLWDDPLYLRLYPVMMSVFMLIIFTISLYRPPSVIETFARLHYGKDLPEHVISYTRKVTKVWCGFFVLNACTAAYTVFATLEIWTLYNGLISYILAGSLFALEFLYRQCVVKKRAKPDDV